MKYTEYDDETLHHLQSIELMILKDFIKICEEHNLKYFIYGGSLLGAIRHSGFIPWDDDLDLIMFRKDFEKFKTIINSLDDDKYKLLTNEIENDYFYLFGKFMLNGTKFEEKWISQVNFNIGINIDIFVLEDLNKNNFKRSYQVKKTFFYNKLSILSRITVDDLPFGPRIISKFVHNVLRLFKINPTFINRRYLSFLNKYADEDSNLVLDNSAQAYPQIFEKYDLEPSVLVQFEDIQVCAPRNYDKVLKSIYGDYMQLPPKEKRYNHPIDNLEFGEY